MNGWPEHACMGCSFVTADQVGNVAHLSARDTTLVFASCAPQPDIELLKARMGWTMPWYTLTDNFVNGRGDEVLSSTFGYLDVTPLGRQELWEDSPEGYPQTAPYEWWNWHDEYTAAGTGPSEEYLAQIRQGVQAQQP